MKKLILPLLLLAGMSFGQTTVAPFLSSKIQLLDNSGVVCSGCLLDTFAAGTTTPLATYSESTGTSLNANPVVLDSAGRATVYLTSASYKFRLRSALGVTLWTQDVISWNTPLTTFAGITDAGALTQTQPTAATNVANQSSFSDCMNGTYWTGAASATDSWCLSDILGTGTNPTSTFTLTHSGSSGASTFSVPGNVSVGGTLSAERFAKNCDASFYAGSDDGAKYAAALADSNCSIVNGYNLVTLTGASPVAIPANKTVIVPCGLYVGATTAFSLAGNMARLIGSGENCTIISTNSGTANIVDIPSPNQWWYLSDFSIRSEVARTAGAGIGCHGGNGIAERIAVYPVFDGVWCDTASVSNNNTFRHMQFTNGTGSPSAGSGGTWHCGVRNGGAAAGTISGNHYTDVVIPMFTAFTDAGFCIQDGSDTTTIDGNSQAVANVGGVDSVAVHIETVNGGLAPTITKFISDEFEGGVTKNAVVVDANVVAGLEFTNVNTNSSLRGYLVNTGSSIHILGGQIYSNQQEGIRAVAFSDLQVIGARFGNNSQQTTVTFDDIFVAANQNQFKILGNTFSDFSNTGKFSKFNVEVAAGTSTFYDISNNLFLPTGTGALSDGGTGLTKHVCNLGSACNIGNSSFQQMGSGSGTVTVQPAAAAGTPTITWPTTTGTLGELTGSQTFFEACSGTASAGTTLAIQWAGGACTSAATALQTPTASAGTLLNMRVKCGTAGTNASSGVFTLNKNGSTATALTCTVGTGTTCNDTTHTVAALAGDTWQVFFTTQAAETLANCAVSWEKQ